MATQRGGEAWPALSASGSTSRTIEKDPFYLHGADHPGLVLVPNHLTGAGNFLPWKRSMLIVLSAKNKLGFIHGKIPQPEEDDESYSSWKIVDSTVMSWILNTLSKELSETFVYADSSKKLWDAIGSRYGQNNGPMRIRIKRQLSDLRQGNSTIIEYFNKLSKLWDELSCIVPVVACDCDIGKIVAQDNLDDRVVQFLMGLNETYDSVVNQIMLMKPLPSIDNVYSMLLTAESQRDVNSNTTEKFDNSAMVARSYTKQGYGRFSSNNNRDKPGSVRLVSIVMVQDMIKRLVLNFMVYLIGTRS